jgi:ferredoxin/flavodoxin---NADP+ reductase
MSVADHKIPARLQSKRELAEGLAIFRFALDQDFHFMPGQHVTLWLTHRGKTIPRPYSVASSPSENRVLEFYINLVDRGELTRSIWDKEVLNGLLAGTPETRVDISGPKGDFLLDPADERDLVFVASGTGLAPFISMIRKLNEDSLAAPGTGSRRVCVIHGVSYSSNLGYRDELERLSRETAQDPERRLALTYIPTISRPHMDPTWAGLKGRAEALFEFADARDTDSAQPQSIITSMLRTMLRPERHVVYVCGYPGTVDNVERLLSLRGFNPGRDVKREKYYK